MGTEEAETPLWSDCPLDIFRSVRLTGPSIFHYPIQKALY